MYQAVPVDKFTGLRLDIPAVDVGAEGAVDLANVDLSQPQQLRKRPGVLTLYTGDFNADYSPEKLVKYGATYVGVGEDAIRKFYLAGPTTWAHTDYSTNGTGGAVVAGSGSTSYLYLGGTGVLERFDGSVVTTVANSPQGARFLELLPTEGRLVAGRGGVGSASLTSRVSFSNAGDAQTFTYSAGLPETGDFVDLDPLDGEEIMGMAVWRDLLFVFKETKFFVFYGTSTDSTGNPIFNYHAVRTGLGCAFVDCVSASRDGVYFIARDGIYRTRGDVPERISQPIDPWFTQEDGPRFFTRGMLGTGPSLMATPRRVLLITDDYDVYVYEIDNGSWTVWDFNDDLRATLVADGRNPTNLLYADLFSLKEISAQYTDDNGTAIDWHYQSGLYDFGSPDDKAIRETIVEGVGAVSLKLSNDGETFDTPEALTLGSTGDARVVRRVGSRGRRFAHHLSGSSTEFMRVSRVTHHLRDARAGR